jgi:hypothetical protein
MADALTSMGKPEKALPLAERALAIYAAKSEGVSPLELADTRFHAARALWDAGRDRKRATELATLARDVYAAEKDDYAARALKETQAWLSAHSGAR